MTDPQANPLLIMIDADALPDFAAIAPEHAIPAIDHCIAEARAVAERRPDRAIWEELIEPLIIAEDRLERVFGPVSHLSAVTDTPEWREAYQACVAKITEFSTELGQNEALYERVQTLRDGDEYTRLNGEQQRVIDHMLRDFRLAGVALDEAAKAQYKTISRQLSEASTTFQQNILDATQAWTKSVDDENRLAGLPESARALLAQNAAEREQAGWLITLDAPSLLAILSHADDRALRAEVYHAFTTRASERGPNGGDYDNGPLIGTLLSLRQQAAQLLGFCNYAERSLATKMAETPAEIEQFLSDLARRSREPAEAELAALAELAAVDGIESLESWDVGYYAEKLKQHRFEFSDEDLRPYFAAPAVFRGLFDVVERLFAVRIHALDDVTTWHDDVTVYRIDDAAGTQLGTFYLDPYARQHKRGGAWMDGFQGRSAAGGRVQTPVAFLTCNFSPPIGDDPALLSHDEVTTVFHEFGHGLHHMLTQVDQAPIAGIAGVEWDAVELPSQFMENWCWHRESLDLFAAHYQTGKPLPGDLFDKLVAAKNHMAGWQMLRQVEFSLFDLRLHADPACQTAADALGVLGTVRDEVAVMQPPADNRFPHSFGHVFAGGYACGYYSYKWAEVLSADAFAAFEDTDIFDTETGMRFKREILERGASRDAIDNFKAFRGRTPSIDALLRHTGLETHRAE